MMIAVYLWWGCVRAAVSGVDSACEWDPQGLGAAVCGGVRLQAVPLRHPAREGQPALYQCQPGDRHAVRTHNSDHTHTQEKGS